MTIRPQAQQWLASRRVPPGHLVTSKLYAPEESWTGGRAWWIKIPWSAVRGGKLIHMVCEGDSVGTPLRHLQVPAAFFLQHEPEFVTLAPGHINLFLAAEGENEFQDQRGPGRVDFAEFERR